MSRATAGSLLIVACAVAWGFISLIVRELPLPALTIVFFRVALSALSIALVLLVARRRDLLRRPPAKVLSLGVLLAAHWACFFAAIKTTSVASANLITYANPILVALLAPALLGERVGRWTVAALVASVAGIALIGAAGGGSGSGAVTPGGVVLAAGAAATYALLILGVKRWAAGIEPVRVVMWHTAVAAAVLSPAAVLPSYSLSGRSVAYLLVLGVALTGLVSVVYIGALHRVPATSAGILSYMEPVSAAVLAAAVLGESLTPAVVAGGALILAAGVAVVLDAPEAVGSGAAEVAAPP